MESNEKKSKRPRIGVSAPMSSENFQPANDYSGKENFGNPASADNQNGSEAQGEQQGGYPPRQGGYQPRQYQQGGYQQRPYNNNRQQWGYQQRPYGNRQHQGGYQPRQQGKGGYQPRPYNNNRQQGEGGYQPRPYNNNRQQGEGGYQPRPYNNNRQQGEGGYQPRPYNNNRQQGEGGYQLRPYNNNRQQGEGGYQPRQQGGYQQRPYGNRQQGGYQPRQQRQYNNQGGQRPYGNRQQRPGQQGGMQRNQYGMPHGGKSFLPRPKRVEYEEPVIDPNESIRLNKYMANAGICSRREADEFIQQGLVKVNGEVVTELGTKITHNDKVEYDDKVVTLERKCYILLNKPKDCVTTSDDPNGRLTVMDLVKNACDERIYPVGRLDRNTTGVLLLTNDGDLASKLTHPKYVKKKIYHVWCDKDIAEEDMQRIADGIELEDGPIHADAISYATMTDRNQAGIEIHSGRNRIVRRIFESLGYHVTKLDRVYFAGLTKKNLPRGRWRYLTQEEVNYLKMGSFE